jgi:hypothetical protein
VSGGVSGRRASHARLSIAALIVLAGCASTSDSSFPVVSGLQAIHLTWQPRAGMRLVYLVTTDVEASGALARPMADKDRKQHISLTRTIEITDVGPEHFDVRFAQDGSAIPATLRFSRAWVAEAVRFDNPPSAASTSICSTRRCDGSPSPSRSRRNFSAAGRSARPGPSTSASPGCRTRVGAGRGR